MNRQRFDISPSLEIHRAAWLELPGDEGVWLHGASVTGADMFIDGVRAGVVVACGPGWLEVAVDRRTDVDAMRARLNPQVQTAGLQAHSAAR